MTLNDNILHHRCLADKNKNVMDPIGPSPFIRFPRDNYEMEETLDYYVKITSILQLNIHLIA